MTTLSIWTFDTETGAEAARRTLERGQHQRLIVVDDASVVAWAADAARPRTYQVGTAAGTAALSGAFWGLLFGTAFLLPLGGGPHRRRRARPPRHCSWCPATPCPTGLPTFSRAATPPCSSPPSTAPRRTR